MSLQYYLEGSVLAFSSFTVKFVSYIIYTQLELTSGHSYYLILSTWLIGKDPDAGRGWGQEEKGTTEDEMAGWHHWLDVHESE